MQTKKGNLVYAVINLAAFIGVVAVNALANILPINGINTGALSDSYPNLFVPAGLTFSIWGVIYLLLALFSVYQLIMVLKGRESKSMEAVGILFIVSSLANIAWIFAWHYLLTGLSLVIMLILLVSLAALYGRLYLIRPMAKTSEKFFIHLPFSIYFGWITVAIIANITAVLVDINWQRFGLSEQFWTVAVIVAAVLIFLYVLFSRQDIFYTLVGVWALYGIYIKRTAVDRMPDQSIVMASAAGAALLSLGIIVQFFRRKFFS